MVCHIMVRVTLIRNVLMRDGSYFRGNYINRKCFDGWCVVVS